MIRFLPIHKREKFAAKFERMKQKPRIFVIEYEEQFTRLSRYAPHLVSTETMKVRRFVWGLANPLFSNLFPMVRRMSYPKIMDATYGLESRKEEWKATKESGKKQKMRGSFSSGSISGGA